MHSSYARHSLLVLALAACADQPGGDAAAEAGGTVVIATGGTAAPMLPALAADAVTRNIADQVYDRLAQIGPNLSTFGDVGFTPRLARGWNWSGDSLSIAFSLAPDARWHDGQPVRASDVKFSFDLIKDPKTGTSLTPLVANIDSISVRDSLTPVAWFHRRTPEQFFDLVYQMHVVPEHVLKGLPREKLMETDMSQRLVGSGRFRLARFEPGVRIELMADTANYRGRPKLDRLIWSMSADAGASIAQLLSGQADVYENLPADLLPQVDSSGRVRAERFKGLASSYLGMNLRDPRRAAAPHPVFGDRQVRRAISMAMDREAMLRNVLDRKSVV